MEEVTSNADATHTILGALTYPSPYPPEWSQWLTVTVDIFDNQHYLEYPLNRPADWFNPFEEPDKIWNRVKGIAKAKDIKEYIEENFPGIDPAEFVKRKKAENKARDIRYCSTTYEMYFDPCTQRIIRAPHRCKHWNDCPKCKEFKLRQNKERLEHLQGKKFVTVYNEQDEKELQKAEAKAGRQYLRIPKSDGSIVFVLDQRGSDDDAIDYKLVCKLAEEMLPGDNGRFSGTLGKKERKNGKVQETKTAVETEDKPEDRLDDCNCHDCNCHNTPSFLITDSNEIFGKPEEPEKKQLDEGDIEIKRWRIRFTEESTLRPAELEKAIYQGVEIDKGLSEDLFSLQRIMDILDKRLSVVCAEHKIEKQFLRREVIHVRFIDISWNIYNKESILADIEVENSLRKE